MTAAVRAAAAAVLLVGLLGLAACTGDAPDGGGSTPQEALEQRIDALPGVADVAVTTEEYEQDRFRTDVEVVAEEEVSAGELATVVEEIEDSAPDLAAEGEQVAGSVTLGPGSASGLRTEPGAASSSAADRATWLLAAIAAVDGTVLVDGDRLRVTVDGGPAAVTGAARAVLADPGLAGVTSVSIGTTSGETYPDGAHLSTSAGLTPALLGQWERLLDAAARVPAGVSARHLYLEDRPDSGAPTALEVHLGIDGLPAGQAPAYPADRDVVGPAVEQVLDVAAGLADGSTVVVTSDPLPFVSVTTGSPATTDGAGDPEWSRDAVRYLDGR